MQTRKQAILFGGAVAMALAAAPAFARVGVDEDAASPILAAAPGGDGGSSSGSGWDDKKGFHIGGGDYSLTIGARLQPGLEYISWDEDLTDEDTVTFRMRRARFYLTGNFMGEDTKFFVQFGADSEDPYWGDSSTAGDLVLFDAWIKHTWKSSFYLKGGQSKVPFSRQNLTSSGKLQFPHRALATEMLNFDMRDVGVEVGSSFNGQKINWALAVVNGNGPNELNADDRVGIYGRLSVNPNGDYGYSEGDTENSDTIASTFGIAAHYQKTTTEDEWLRVNLDGGIKYRGWGFQADAYWQRIDPETSDDEITTKSFYVQGGYFVDPERIELAARWSRVINEGSDNDDSEYSLGLNWYMKGHRLKWQTAYSLYDSEADSIKNHRLTTQAQIWF